LKCSCCGQEIRQASTARFDEFWAAYPQKVDKAPSLKIWKRRKLDAMADMIIKAVQNRVENDPRWAAGYIMSPRRFLLNDNWEDEINPKEMPVKWPQKNDEWLALGSKHGLSPGIGEDWPKFKSRVMGKVST